MSLLNFFWGLQNICISTITEKIVNRDVKQDYTNQESKCFSITTGSLYHKDRIIENIQIGDTYKKCVLSW